MEKTGSPSATNVSFCSLVGHLQVDRAIMSAYSITRFFADNIPYRILDDGTLTINDRRNLRIKIRNCQVITRQEADMKLKSIYHLFPNLTRYHFDPQTPMLKLKFGSILLSPTSRNIYLDSDILFFKPPETIINWINQTKHLSMYSVYHPDITINFRKIYSPEFPYRKLLQLRCGIIANHLLNSSILCISHLSDINLYLLDNICKIFYETDYAYHYFSEETAFSVLFSQSNSRPLDYLHYRTITMVDQAPTNIPISLHYAYHAKNLMVQHYNLYCNDQHNFISRLIAKLK